MRMVLPRGAVSSIINNRGLTSRGDEINQNEELVHHGLTLNDNQWMMEMAVSRNVVCLVCCILISPIDGNFDRWQETVRIFFRNLEDDLFGKIGYYSSNLLILLSRVMYSFPNGTFTMNRESVGSTSLFGGDASWNPCDEEIPSCCYNSYIIAISLCFWTHFLWNVAYLLLFCHSALRIHCAGDSGTIPAVWAAEICGFTGRG